MINKETLYSLDDVVIEAAAASTISHRSECKTRRTEFDGKEYLPLFTAPMPCVVNLETMSRYVNAGIMPILPRMTDSEFSMTNRFDFASKHWVAFSLDEISKFDEYEVDKDCVKYIVIDIANGHMTKLGDAIKNLKAKHPKFKVMTGNIANPETFKYLSECGADYVKISVGTGSACLSTTFTAVHYPMASLIEKCRYYKVAFGLSTQIIADGGMKNYRDIIKCLALGADYVMLGGMLNACVDSAGDIVLYDDKRMKEYYGMASRKGAEKIGKNTDYPEGKVKYNTIGGTISDFADEFDGYLRSAMSYTNARTLEDFNNKTKLNVISLSAQKAFNQN